MTLEFQEFHWKKQLTLLRLRLHMLLLLWDNQQINFSVRYSDMLVKALEPLWMILKSQLLKLLMQSLPKLLLMLKESMRKRDFGLELKLLLVLQVQVAKEVKSKQMKTMILLLLYLGKTFPRNLLLKFLINLLIKTGKLERRVVKISKRFSKKPKWESNQMD